MAWVRIHDGALSHPKLVGLIDWKNPFCLWVWGLSYCQMHLTDGLIPVAAVPNPTALKTAAKLVEAGNWESDASGGFRVHDYLDWNDSRELVSKKRTEAKERMANARSRSSRELLRRSGVREEESLEDLKEEEKKESARPLRPIGPALRSRGVFAGSLPSDHMHHAACGPNFSWCVPRGVHAKLVNKLAPKHGGDNAAADLVLRAWYPTVWAVLPADFVLPSDDFKFWQSQFDPAFASASEPPKKASDYAAVPKIDADEVLRILHEQDTMYGRVKR